MSAFLHNFVRLCPMKLKIGISYHMINTFRKNFFFFISVAVPSIYQKELLAQANKYFKEKNLEIKVASRYQLYQGVLDYTCHD